jgi:hypothetical protein
MSPTECGERFGRKQFATRLLPLRTIRSSSEAMEKSLGE